VSGTVTELAKDIIERAFDAIGQMAAERGLIVEIKVFGGSCFAPASDIRMHAFFTLSRL
jgi:hypothetical protein